MAEVIIVVKASGRRLGSAKQERPFWLVDIDFPVQARREFESPYNGYGEASVAERYR